MAVQRKSLDFESEKRILINIILNDDYCSRILPLLKDDYFPSDATRTIISWVREYYESYNTAPKTHINTIFEEEGRTLEPSTLNQVQSILQHLSDVADTNIGNIDYLCDKAVKFLHAKDIKLKIKVAQQHIDNNQPEKAQIVLDTPFTGQDKILPVVHWGDKKYLRGVVRKMVQHSDDDKAFFRYRGRVGTFLGNIDRGWFIAFAGPAKRGKTVYLMETVLTAVLRKRNTVFISFEMPADQLHARVLKSVTGNLPNQDKRVIFSPMFDCVANQHGICALKERTGVGQLIEPGGELPPYEEVPDWVRCEACRGTPKFIPTAWKEPVTKLQYKQEEYFKRAYAFMKMYGKYCRTIFRPSRTCTVSTLQHDLDNLIKYENFVPEIVVIDYADLMIPERVNSQRRFDLDTVWEGLRALGQDRKVLVVSASQTNRSSADAKYVRDIDIAEDFSKIAKLDLGIGICQTPEMKLNGEMNLNKIANRHGEFVYHHTCTVLQELTHMQGILDSEFQYL